MAVGNTVMVSSSSLKELSKIFNLEELLPRDLNFLYSEMKYFVFNSSIPRIF